MLLVGRETAVAGVSFWGLMSTGKRQLRTKALFQKYEEFTLYGDDGKPFTAKWHWDHDGQLSGPNLTNLGLTGWARIDGD